jgi:hypothetical protein
MTATDAVLPLLVFEAAGCLMAVPASEVRHLEGSDPLFSKNENQVAVDLGAYFAGLASDGPWLRWQRGTHAAWLRIRRVVDVVPVALSGLTQMPALLRGDKRTRAFLAAGVREDDVFLLLDPARLSPDSFALKAGLAEPSRLPDASTRRVSS